MKIFNQIKANLTSMLCLVLLILAGCNMDHHITPEEEQLSEVDEAFIADATYVNIVGIEYGHLAESRSQTGMVLAYANRVIEEHTMSAEVLEAIAQDYEVATPETVHPEWQSHQEQLAGMSGRDFDSLYIQRKIEVYLWAQDMIEEYVNLSNVDVLTDYARQELLQINLRLDDARMIQSELQ